MTDNKLFQKVLEVCPILLGFFLGQGTFFLLQSYLVFNDDFASVARLSIGLGVLSTCIWLCDLGGGVFQARNCSKDGVCKEYLLNYLVARIVMLPVGLSVLALFWYFETSSEVMDIYEFGVIGVVLWTLNWTGVFDSQGINRKVAIFQSTNFLSVSAYVYFNEEFNWSIVGLVFSLGVLVTIIIHNYTLLKYVNFSSDKSKVSILDIIKEGLTYNVSFSFGQMYGRVIQLSINNLMGLNAGGGYAYAKSLVSAVQQLIGFIKRVELPAFYAEKKGGVITPFKLSWSFCIISMIGVVVLASLFGVDFIDKDAATYIIAFSILMPLWLASAILGNNLIALGMTKYYVFSQFVGFTCAAIIVYLTFSYMLIWAVWLSELILFIVQIIILIKILSKYEKENA